MMEPYILGISGSPRTGGNTDQAVRLAIETISKAKKLPCEFIRIADLNLKPCLGCRSCMKHSDCAIRDDDFHPLFDKIIHPVVLILGAPVYWYGPPAAMKNFIDRTHAYYACPETIVSTTRVGIITVAADSGFANQEAIMTSWLRHYHLHVTACLRLIAREKDDFAHDPDKIIKVVRFAKSFEKG